MDGSVEKVIIAIWDRYRDPRRSGLKVSSLI
jgi:hypothetical protein